MSEYKQIRFYDLINQLRNVRQQVQSGQLRLVGTYEAKVIAFLLPIQDVQGLDLKNTTTVNIPSIFLEDWHRYQEWMQGDNLDAVFITYQTRARMVLLSAKFQAQLHLPLIGDPDLVVMRG